MSEPVLERSVLERKERDELKTIVEALGAKAPARAKKADLVDLILTTAGVAPAPAPKAASAAKPAPEAEPEAPAPAPAPTAAAIEAAVEENGAREDRPERDDRQREQQPQGDRARWDEDGEPGNRRGRRRRGRDRDNRGANPQQGGQPGQQQDNRPDEPFTGDPIDVEGLLDLRAEGYGFLRTKGYLPSKDDVYVSVKQARQFGLRSGDHIAGAMRPAGRNEKNPALLRIDQVNGKDPDAARSRPRFEDLTPLFPDEKLKLEGPGASLVDMTARIVDLIAPIGKGQRGLIVSPPKAGKTTVVKQIVKSIEANNPEVRLMVLLVDERPEEVTDMRRSTNGEVIASTFDRPAEEHTQLAELTIERAKRLVEYGEDVVIVLDGITRLARA
ncbi:MAG TPA: transcription termination factor Rho, partial [Acidimicrobiales bacterium]|nr:transcription termination factor Rho [Acidimicrobiales bacterium]